MVVLTEEEMRGIVLFEAKAVDGEVVVGGRRRRRGLVVVEEVEELERELPRWFRREVV